MYVTFMRYLNWIFLSLFNRLFSMMEKSHLVLFDDIFCFCFGVIASVFNGKCVVKMLSEYQNFPVLFSRLNLIYIFNIFLFQVSSFFYKTQTIVQSFSFYSNFPCNLIVKSVFAISYNFNNVFVYDRKTMIN